ncbi:hypothetical protein OFN33_31430, partial [Escherichia coli]|nr:hypothetical protein [Escherichia coli]
AINEFFRKRAEANSQNDNFSAPAASDELTKDGESKPASSPLERLKAFAASSAAQNQNEKCETSGFFAGMHVRHEKYGKGL